MAPELEYYLQDRGKMDELAQIKTISEMAAVSYVPFGVFLGDDIIVARVPCMRQLLNVFERHPNNWFPAPYRALGDPDCIVGHLPADFHDRLLVAIEKSVELTRKNRQGLLGMIGNGER